MTNLQRIAKLEAERDKYRQALERIAEEEDRDTMECIARKALEERKDV